MQTNGTDQHQRRWWECRVNRELSKFDITIISICSIDLIEKSHITGACEIDPYISDHLADWVYESGCMDNHESVRNNHTHQAVNAVVVKQINHIIRRVTRKMRENR